MTDKARPYKDLLAEIFKLKSTAPSKEEIRRFFRAAETNDTNALEKILKRWPEAVTWLSPLTGNGVIPEAVLTMKSPTLELLLKHGADIDLFGSGGLGPPRTGLIRAVLNTNLGAAEMLLSHGAKIDLPDMFGSTPLMIGVTYQIRPLVELLVLAGADTTLRDKNDKTVFDLARTEKIKATITSAQKRRAEFLAAPKPPFTDYP